MCDSKSALMRIHKEFKDMKNNKSAFVYAQPTEVSECLNCKQYSSIFNSNTVGGPIRMAFYDQRPIKDRLRGRSIPWCD
jgi:hypothetical protein